MAVVEEQGGAVEAVPYMKARLVESHRERIARIERGEIKVIGQNSFTESEDSPLTADADGGILTPDPEVERECRDALEKWRAERDSDAVEKALADLREAAADEQRNIMPATIAAAKAGVTTGEWAQALRDAFGDYRGPTGVGASSSGASRGAARRRFARGWTRSPTRSGTGSASWSASPASTGTPTAPSRSRCVRETWAWR